MKKILFFLLISAGLNMQQIFPQSRWTFELSSGIPLNIPFPLSIYQDNEATIKINSAKFYSEPFVLPPYWDWRFSRTGSKNFWELEAIHHKLYLDTRHPDIQRFSISHGFNIFTVNYGWLIKKFRVKIGAGTVFSHPETEIRNKKFEDSGNFLNTVYHISGPIVNMGINRRWYMLKRWFCNVEIKNTFAYTAIPVAEGHANFFTSTFHFTAGLGYDFILRED